MVLIDKVIGRLRLGVGTSSPMSRNGSRSSHATRTKAAMGVGALRMDQGPGEVTARRYYRDNIVLARGLAWGSRPL